VKKGFGLIGILIIVGFIAVVGGGGFYVIKSLPEYVQEENIKENISNNLINKNKEEQIPLETAINKTEKGTDNSTNNLKDTILKTESPKKETNTEDDLCNRVYNDFKGRGSVNLDQSKFNEEEDEVYKYLNNFYFINSNLSREESCSLHWAIRNLSSNPNKEVLTMVLRGYLNDSRAREIAHSYIKAITRDQEILDNSEISSDKNNLCGKIFNEVRSSNLSPRDIYRFTENLYEDYNNLNNFNLSLGEACIFSWSLQFVKSTSEPTEESVITNIKKYISEDRAREIYNFITKQKSLEASDYLKSVEDYNSQ